MILRPPTRCVCLLGYGGEFCERTLDACVSRPCANGGVCRALATSFSCSCPDDGRRYDDRCGVVECTNATCRNGGVCSAVGVCVCVDGFVGVHCHLVAGSCDGGPCRNDGTCVDDARLSAHECRCPADWEGPDCGRRVADRCFAHTCPGGVGFLINHRHSISYSADAYQQERNQLEKSTFADTETDVQSNSKKYILRFLYDCFLYNCSLYDCFSYNCFLYDCFLYDWSLYDCFSYNCFLYDCFLYDCFSYHLFFLF